LIKNLIFYQLNKQNDDEKESKYPDELNGDAIPSDIEQALITFFASTQHVQMHYDAMYNHRAYAFLSSLLMTATRTFAKLDIVKLIFPNLQTFAMDGVPLTSLTFLYIKSMIGNACNPPNVEEEKDDHKQDEATMVDVQLREIKLLHPKTAAMSVDAVIESEKRNFAEMQWTIDRMDGTDGIICAYSENPVVIKEPTPTPPPVVIEEEKKEQMEEPKKKKKVLKKRRKKKIKKQPEGNANNAENEKEQEAPPNPESEGQEQQQQQANDGISNEIE